MGPRLRSGGGAQNIRRSASSTRTKQITQLAHHQPRNDFIWRTYVDRRAEFGKTIIFADRWFQCNYLCDIQRTINMSYQCAAVDEIEMKSKVLRRREWRIRLRTNNPGAWLDEHLQVLFDRIRDAQAGDRSGPVRSILLESPDGSGDGTLDVFRVYWDGAVSGRPLAAAQIRPRMKVAVYWPNDHDLPAHPIPAKVLRVDPRKREADVRTTVGRSERDISVPFKAIFDAAVLREDAEQE